MLAALDIVIYLKSHDDLDRMAERVFSALGSPGSEDTNEELGERLYRSAGLGFQAMLYENTGDQQDPEFEGYQFSLNISSQYSDVELDAFDLDEPLSEYYARMLAFTLDVETATEILLETTEEGELLEIRAYKRNPQYRKDQGAMAQKVGVIEARQVLEPFGEDEIWEEIGEETEGEDEEE